MKTDRELLELAARAAGIVLLTWNDGQECYSSGEGFITPSNAIWNPLKDDGDALRLAVKMVQMHGFYKFLRAWMRAMSGEQGSAADSSLATRRAITRAAAQIQLDKETT